MLGAVQIVPPDIRIEPPGAAPFSMTSGRAPASMALTRRAQPGHPATADEVDRVSRTPAATSPRDLREHAHQLIRFGHVFTARDSFGFR